ELVHWPIGWLTMRSNIPFSLPMRSDRCPLRKQPVNAVSWMLFPPARFRSKRVSALADWLVNYAQQNPI
ncbi:hypothetical protein, partial [Agarivorans sp.]|uniref:hypothetical protein n=1 Tax=Agarivorans sp. TaxID=1872412 RepID=UPI003D0824D1